MFSPIQNLYSSLLSNFREQGAAENTRSSLHNLSKSALESSLSDPNAEKRELKECVDLIPADSEVKMEGFNPKAEMADFILLPEASPNEQRRSSLYSKTASLLRSVHLGARTYPPTALTPVLEKVKTMQLERAPESAVEAQERIEAAKEQLKELKEKVSPGALTSFTAYLTNREIPLINNDDIIDLLLLSKAHGEASLYMHCLEHVLDTRNSYLDRHNLSEEQNDLLSLLREARQNRITTSKHASGIACINLDGSNEAQWKCLSKLHAFMPITHLDCTQNPYRMASVNFDLLLPFLQSNKNLIHLGLGPSAEIGAEKLEEIALHLPALKSFSIRNAPVRHIPESISRQVERLDCNGCSSITALNAPLATTIQCNHCTNLVTLNAPLATTIQCNHCTNLVTLNAPQATTIDCAWCTALVTLNAPQATTIQCNNCSWLSTLDAPQATEIECLRCTALVTLNAPQATTIQCYESLALVTLDAPQATTIDCAWCRALTTLKAPQATTIDCSWCTALVTLNAPQATTIECGWCTALVTLNAPQATTIQCNDCTHLVTINAPQTTKIECNGCTALVTLSAPQARQIQCYNCKALVTLNAPQATIIECDGCKALVTINAPQVRIITLSKGFRDMTSEATLKIFTLLKKNIYAFYYTKALDPGFESDLDRAFTLIADQKCVLNQERSFADWFFMASKLTIPAIFDSEAQELTVKREIENCLEELLILAHAKGFEENNLKWFQELRKKFSSPQQQMKCMFWFGALLACSVPGKNPFVDQNGVSTLFAIGNLTDPLLQRGMTQILLPMYDEDALKAFTTWADLSKKIKKPHQILPSLVLSKAQLVKEDIEVLLESLEPAYYKNRLILTPILETICLLLQREPHENLLKLLLKAPERKNGEKNASFKERLVQHRKDQHQWVRACLDLLFFKKDYLLLDIANGDDLLEKHTMICRDFFGIKEELALKFSETFASKRYPNALPTYAARLQVLPESEKNRLTEALGTFVNAHIEGSFPESRYDLAINPHLKQIFENNPALLEKWKAPLEIDLSDEVVPQSTSSCAHDTIKYLMANAIASHHLGADQDAMYPTLIKILTPGNSEDIATSLTSLQEAFSGLSVALDRKKKDCLSIEIDCLKALDPRTAATTRIGILRSLSTKLELAGSLEFKNDVLGILKAILPSKTMGLRKIESTESCEDLILMGTEVNNSCQRIDGDPDYNKCLLAYILDGKNKAIIVRDAEGKIAARSVLRILWNEKQKCPVLFMEQIYTRTSDPSLPDLIRKGCECKAAEMGLFLVASPQDFSEAADYGGTLLALGGPAPFEYVDALSGVKENGVFTISNSRVLYTPRASQNAG